MNINRWKTLFCSSFPSNKCHLSIKITHWVSAVIDFQVRCLHQLLCSTLPLLASNYTSGHFHLIPMCGVTGDISVTSHSFKGSCDTLRKCCSRSRVPQHKQRNVEHSALVDPLHIPSSPPHSTSPAIRCCGLWLGGNRDVDRCHHNQDPQELSLLPTSTFQSPVPPTTAEARCTGTLITPASLSAIDYLSKSPFDYLSENKTL